jgi:hypothetical protein
MARRLCSFRILNCRISVEYDVAYKNPLRPCKANERVIARFVVTNKANQKKAAVVLVRISWLHHVCFKRSPHLRTVYADSPRARLADNADSPRTDRMQCFVSTPNLARPVSQFMSWSEAAAGMCAGYVL